MALNKIIKAETLINGLDLKLTDQSEYNNTTPKSLYANRHVVISFADGTIVTKEFPYTNADNTLEDTITYTNIFTKDSYVDIEVDFIYLDSGTATEALSFPYLSTIFTLKCRSSLANSICGCDDCHDEYKNLDKIDSNLLSAQYAALFTEPEKSQKFLDKCYDICESIKNKNCKDC